MSSERTYWRSLGEARETPAFGEALGREFPEGASEAPDGITRRTMLTLVGASLSLAGLGACRRPKETIVPFVEAPEQMVPGIPLRYATTMPWRGSALGIVVESNEGRPTKVEGNELHPATRGAANAWAQAAIYDLYDPDRARGVRQATADGWEAKTWQDFATAWKPLRDGFEASGGEGLALVLEPYPSPTRARVLEQFRSAFPKARVVFWTPLGDEARHAGVARAAGGPHDLVPRIDRARVILSLDSDFLLHDPDAVRLARELVDGRRGEGAMNRLYVAESTVTITGVSADHRLAVQSGRIGALAAALAGELQSQGVALRTSGLVPQAKDFDPKWVTAVAKDLKQNAGRSLILCGSEQPPAVHAAVLAMNAALGNVGETVALVPAAKSPRSSAADLAALAGDLKGGKVDTVVMLGGNPAWDAPADLGFAKALAGAKTRIRVGTHFDETSRLSTWHLPLAHFLEAWGDGRTVGGPLSLAQPLVEPLFGGKSDVETLWLLAEGTEKPGYELVRETWKPILGEGDFESRWQKTLHDGVLAGSELAAASPSVDLGVLNELVAGPFVSAPVAGATAPEVVFRPSNVLGDGRWANVGWLQELPDPVTKLTWDNAALLSVKTAKELGVEDGDLLRIRVRDREATLPALVVPGQADGSISLALGHGREVAGRVGTGSGFDVYRLRTTAAPGFAPAKVERTGGRHELAHTQEHWTTEGRDIVREVNVAAAGGGTSHGEAGHGAEPHGAPPTGAHAEAAAHGEPAGQAAGGHGAEAHHGPPLESLWEERKYAESPQWGMAIDLTACIGCNACIVACQSENNIPVVGKDQVSRGREMQWLRVDRYYSGSPEAPETIAFQPVPCMHCENAPCEQVCPVAATVHDGQGLNVMVYNRCIGTRYCSNNCPYKVRRFNFYNFTKDTPESLKMAQNPDVSVRARGVMEKCSYCVQRINRARIDAKLAGREPKDGDVQTACQQTCPTRAIEFGDIRDPKSRVTAAKASSRNYSVLAYLNTKPRTTYLSRVRNPNPELEKA